MFQNFRPRNFAYLISRYQKFKRKVKTPDLVTWPTRKMGMLVLFAIWLKATPHSRTYSVVSYFNFFSHTCTKPPGPPGTPGSMTDWIESIITAVGRIFLISSMMFFATLSTAALRIKTPLRLSFRSWRKENLDFRIRDERHGRKFEWRFPRL